jgi:hypothetical protein
MRGRKQTLHDPVRISFWTEAVDKKVARASGVTEAAIFRMGLKTLGLNGGKSSLMRTLAEAEERMAGEHEDLANYHRQKAEDIRSKTTGNGPRLPTGTAGESS